MKRIKVNGQEIDIPDEALCLIPEQGMRVTVPDYTEINGRNTVDCILNMAQDKWEHISTGPLFRHFFDLMFKDKGIVPPLFSEIQDTDHGVLHISGLIILFFEAVCERKESVFIRDPETHLHPGITVKLMTLIEDLKKLGRIK